MANDDWSSDNIHAAASRLYNSLPYISKKKAQEKVLQADEERWCSGQDSLDLIAEKPFDLKTGKPFSKTAIRICVGMMYDKDDETIRLREHIVKNVGELRHEYSPGLITFEHWRAMIGVKPKDGESKQDALRRIANEVVAYSEAWGHKPTPGMVRSWSHKGRVVDAWMLHTAGLISKFDRIFEDKKTPVRLHGFIGYARMVIRRFLETGVIYWGLSEEVHTDTDDDDQSDDE